MLPVKRRSTAGDLEESRQVKHGAASSAVAYIKSIQVAGDRLHDSSSKLFNDSSLCAKCRLHRRAKRVRRKKSLTVLWERARPSSSGSSLSPRSVEATTDLRARLRRELLSNNMFLLQSLFVLLSNKLLKRQAHGLAAQSTQSDLRLRLRLVSERHKSQELSHSCSLTHSTATQSLSAAAAPKHSPDTACSCCCCCCFYCSPAACSRSIAKSKSADDLLNKERGRRQRLALCFIGYRNLLRR